MKPLTYATIGFSVLGLGLIGFWYTSREPKIPIQTPVALSNAEREQVDNVLVRYNAFRSAHPNCSMQVLVSGDGIEAEAMGHFQGEKWLIQSTFLKPIKLTIYQAPGDGSVPICYFPASNLTVAEIDPLTIFCLTELSWHQSMTREKIEAKGGWLRHKRNGDVDVLTIIFPEGKFATASGDRGKGQAIVEYEIDQEGRITRSLTTADGMEMSSRYKYVSFEESAVSAVLSSTKIKRKIDQGVTYEDAIAEEAVKVFTGSLTSK